MNVIFDTNAYRNFVFAKSSDDCISKIEDIVAKQNLRNITSFISTTVAEELICHLYDNNSFNPEGDCTKALRTLYAHCGDETSYKIIPKPEVQIARDFFGEIDNKGIRTQTTVAQICYSLYKNPTASELSKYNNQISTIKKHNEEVEAEVGKFFDILADVWRNSKDKDDKKSESVKDISALSFVVSVAEKNGYNGPKDYESLRGIFGIMTEIYKSQYPAPLQMRENFVRKLTNPRFIPNKPERVNMVWDSLILHYSHQSINGDPFLIVTSDTAMREAAIQTAPTYSSTPFPGNVVTLQEYLGWLS